MKDAERWAAVERIFNHAVDMPPSDRCFYLDLMCGQDESLRKEVEGLLNAHTESSEKDWLAKVSRPTLFDPGEKLDEFEVQRLLGQGAIGDVYQVLHPRTLAIFAVKCLSPIYNRDEQLLRRFQHEATLAQKLVHPTICKTFGLRESESGVRYLVMEYCQGETLAKILQNGPCKPTHCLAIAEQVGLGLRVAHHHNIWHRDIKPGNIIVNREGIKIVDFGIAKDATTELTITGTRLGSPGYMAPEQWRMERVDHRVDIWQLGVMLYEMLTGRLPFEGRDQKYLQKAVLNDPFVPASVAAPTLPKEVDALLSRMLAKAREERPRDMDEVLEQIQRLRPLVHQAQAGSSA